MTAENLSGWVKDPEARKRYVEAFQKSDFTAMLNYYKANYPRVQPGVEPPPAPPPPKARMPVLMIHGLEDPYLLAAALNGTWEWLEKDLTLVTIPGANHFVQQDASELVSKTMKSWLTR
jgi:pimeloyl-ACP methyl ester carboxylesterase